MYRNNQVHASICIRCIRVFGCTSTEYRHGCSGRGPGPSEGPSDIECGCCYSDYPFEEMVHARKIIFFVNLQLFLVARLFMCSHVL